MTWRRPIPRTREHSLAVSLLALLVIGVGPMAWLVVGTLADVGPSQLRVLLLTGRQWHLLGKTLLVLKAPGEADKTAPQVWEIDSYALTPGFLTVQQGDTVTLHVLVVNGDKHEVGVLAPDGQVVEPKATWNRGVEYRISFVAEKVGTYKPSCETHAPTMTANILVLPR
jgi:plastocyanin